MGQIEHGREKKQTQNLLAVRQRSEQLSLGIIDYWVRCSASQSNQSKMTPN